MRMMSGILSLGLGALLCVGCSDSPTSSPSPSPTNNNVVVGDPVPQPPSGPEVFRSVMNGQQEVPAVATIARGSTSFHMSQDGSSIIYSISVNDISDVTMAHIHVGAPGEAGPPVVDLFVGSRPGRYDGQLVQGSITPSMLKGQLAGMRLGDLISLMSSGRAYVNVHTVQHPQGEIRGQITTVPQPGGDQ